MTRITFLGDISFNDAYNNLYDKKQNPFAKVEHELKKSDFVIGNLECIAKGDKGFNLLKKPRLSTNIETLNFLENLNAGLVTLATNHVYDNMEDGFVKTTDFLTRKNIDFIGCSTTKEDAGNVVLKNINDLSFCFINYVTKDTNPSVPDDAKIYPNYFSIEQCIKDLKANKQADYKVVLLHWGGKYEGGLYPGLDQAKTAKKLIANGADLIIGHHSHTFHPYEKIKGKHVFYSLGNFCFSDIVSDGKVRSMSKKRLLESAMVHIDFTKKGYKINLSPIVNKDLSIHINNIFLFKIYWRNIIFKIFKFVPPLWKVYFVNHKYIRPLINGIFRKDKSKSLFTRIKEFNISKVKAVIKK